MVGLLTNRSIIATKDHTGKLSIVLHYIEKASPTCYACDADGKFWETTCTARRCLSRCRRWGCCWCRKPGPSLRESGRNRNTGGRNWRGCREFDRLSKIEICSTVQSTHPLRRFTALRIWVGQLGTTRQWAQQKGASTSLLNALDSTWEVLRQFRNFQNPLRR